MSTLYTLIVCGIIGWIAGIVMGSKGGIIRNIILGLVGGVVGRYLFGLIGLSGSSSLGSGLISVIGACIVIWLGRMLTDKRKN